MHSANAEIACCRPSILAGLGSFALLGFYSALAPSLLQRSLGVESHAVGGAVIFELYAVAVLVLALTHWLGARAAMLWVLSLLLTSLERVLRFPILRGFPNPANSASPSS